MARRYGGGPRDRLTLIVSALRLAARRAEQESGEVQLYQVCGPASANLAAELQELSDAIKELEESARETHGALAESERAWDGQAAD